MRVKKRNEYDVFISLGSNEGNRCNFINRAVELMDGNIGAGMICSAFYETEPWGDKEQEGFINQLVSIKTTLSPWKLLEELQTIERNLHKTVKRHWGPRTIDLDIIYFGDKIIFEKQLIIPHPYMYLRNFVLVPLFEIAPHQRHPMLRKVTAELLENCRDTSLVHRL